MPFSYIALVPQWDFLDFLAEEDLGAPMDVFWFGVPRRPTDTDDFFGVVGRGNLMALLPRGEYWQIAYVIPKGSAQRVRELRSIRRACSAWARGREHVMIPTRAK